MAIIRLVGVIIGGMVSFGVGVWMIIELTDGHYYGSSCYDNCHCSSYGSLTCYGNNRYYYGVGYGAIFGIMMFLFLYFFIGMLTNSCLIHGLRKKNPSLLTPWMLIQAFGIVVTLLLEFATICFCFALIFIDDDLIGVGIGSMIGSIFASVVFSGWEMICWYNVYAIYKDFKIKQN